MPQEYGLFNEEGCVESGFYTQEEAKDALDRYHEEDGLYVASVCPQHPDEEAEYCTQCAEE